MADKRELPRGAEPSAQRTKQLGKLDAELKGVVRGFREKLASMQALDPAAGSGNFLYVALRQMLDLGHAYVGLADLSDEELLSHLLALNLERAG